MVPKPHCRYIIAEKGLQKPFTYWIIKALLCYQSLDTRLQKLCNKSQIARLHPCKSTYYSCKQRHVIRFLLVAYISINIFRTSTLYRVSKKFKQCKKQNKVINWRLYRNALNYFNLDAKTFGTPFINYSTVVFLKK